MLLGCQGLVQAAQPRVAVFSEPVFPTFAGAQGLMPDDVRQTLAGAGLSAELVDAAALSDPTRFNARAFAVLVHIYGNTFPLEAVGALRAFRHAGGSVVAFGVPFCHPCVEAGVAGWTNSGEPADLVARTADGRNGTHGVLIRRAGTTEGAWAGIWSPQMRAAPGSRWVISGWVRSHGQFAHDDDLYVRFWDIRGKFLGQTGPAFPPAAADWTLISAEVTAPPATHALDVCLALFRPGEVVCDDLCLAPADAPDRNLLHDPGFERPAAGRWGDLGHVNDYLSHDGLGMGGFRIVDADGRYRYAPTSGDPIGLADVAFPPIWVGKEAVVDETTFPPEDRVFPLIATLGPDGKPAGYGVALIEHHCPQFRGALDVWAGYPAPAPRQALQVVTDACAFILERKGLIGRRAVDAARRHARSLPEAGQRMYSLIPPVRRAAVLPKSPPPGGRILVTTMVGLSWQERIAAAALQGLVNRRQPTIYFADAWTDAVAAGRTREDVDDPLSLVDRYRRDLGGAVVYDPDFPPGINIAISLAGARGLLPCTAELAKRLGLPVKADLRGRWTTLADAYDWARRQVLPECSRDAVCHIKQGEPLSSAAAEMSAAMVDYLVAERIFSFHLNMAYSQRERQVAEEILAAYPALTPVIGYFGPEPTGAPNLGSEPDVVTIVSRLGKDFVFTVNGNLSYHSGFSSVRGRQTTRPAPALDPGKVYVAFYLSDGDSPSTWYGTWCRWNDAERGQVPIGWSFPVAALDLCPLVAERTYREATPQDELVMACSGLGYCYPEMFGAQVRGGSRLLHDFLAETGRGMERSAMDIMHVHHYGGTTDATLARYAAEVPGIRAVFADYGRTRTGYAESSFAVGDVPVFHCLTTGGDRDTTGAKLTDQMLAQILAAAPTERPAFILAFGIYWFMGPKEVKAIVDRLPADYVAVRPSELADLYRQARSP
jgi:hypothetical protein